jgi:hypothetical protein
MNGFQTRWWGISAQFKARMSGKKIANWTVGKIIVVLQLALAAPAAAIGPCEAQSQLSPRQIGGLPRPPLAIGDSVMLGAADSLAHAGVRVNARGCRQMSAGLDILAARRRLPPVVILSLGTNWYVTAHDIRRALHIVEPPRRLVLVTPRGDGADARVMRRAAHRHRRVCLADWARHSAGHPQWAPGDGIHLSYSGIDAFVDLLRPYRRVTADHPGACGPRSGSRRSRRPRH